MSRVALVGFTSVVVDVLAVTDYSVWLSAASADFLATVSWAIEITDDTLPVEAGWTSDGVNFFPPASPRTDPQATNVDWTIPNPASYLAQTGDLSGVSLGALESSQGVVTPGHICSLYTYRLDVDILFHVKSGTIPGAFFVQLYRVRDDLSVTLGIVELYQDGTEGYVEQSTTFAEDDPILIPGDTLFAALGAQAAEGVTALKISARGT